MKKTLLNLLVFAMLGSVSFAQINENFETDPLTGWTFYQTENDDPGFIQTNNFNHGGAASFYHNDDNTTVASTSWMVSPLYNSTMGSTLSFWYRQNWTDQYYYYSGVWISTTSSDPIANPTAFTQFLELNASSSSGFSEDYWSSFAENLDAYNGQAIYIAIKYTGDFSHELYIDDFRLAKSDTIYVNHAATGSKNGTSWTDAYSNLNTAMDTANAKDIIWVAKGTYTPDRDGYGNLTPSDSREKLFSIDRKEINLYGGFEGTEAHLSQRDWIENSTILSGDIGIYGTIMDNCYTVFAVSRANFILNGFTISDGYADGLGSDPVNKKVGAGIFLSTNGGTNDMKIKNCIIKNNEARAEAGLLCLIEESTSNLTVENTRFTGNVARWAAPFSIFVYSGIANPIFTNCLIDNNRTEFFNGEVGNTFSGGRYIRYTDGVLNGKIINCTFTKNSETSSSVSDANRAVLGIQGEHNNTEIYNTIFWDNNVNTTNTSIGYSSSSVPDSVKVFNTISEDTLSNLSYITVINNTHIDPLFTDTASEDYTLQATSLAIDAGDTSFILHLLPLTDFQENNRIEGAIDLGCFEHNKPIDNNINDNFKTLITIYPNPATTQLNVSVVDTKIINTSIMDIMGKVILNNINKSTINITDLANGIYFVKITTSKGIFTSKFIKK